MDLAAYLGTVALAMGAIYAIVGQVGRRIDEQGAGLNARIDELSAGLNARIDQQGAGLNGRIDDLSTRVSRIETQNDAILAAVGDLGQRVAHLGARSA